MAKMMPGKLRHFLSQQGQGLGGVVGGKDPSTLGRHHIDRPLLVCSRPGADYFGTAFAVEPAIKSLLDCGQLTACLFRRDYPRRRAHEPRGVVVVDAKDAQQHRHHQQQRQQRNTRLYAEDEKGGGEYQKDREAGIQDGDRTQQPWHSHPACHTGTD